MRFKDTLAGVAARVLDLRLQRAWFRHPVAKGLFVAAAVVLIMSQQASFLLRPDNPPTFYKNVINLGASYQRFFSVFYYFGGFPVNLDGEKTRTREDTINILKARDARLTPESSVYNRASIFLFYPDAWWKGRPDVAEMRSGHALWFTIALLSLFIALCYVGLPVFGLLVTMLCGSDPFQVYELYHVSSSRIFPTVISTGLVIVAACTLLANERFVRQRVRALLLVAACGAIAAFQYEIRLEGVGVFAGAVFSLVACWPISARRKLSCAALFLASAMATNALVNAFFTWSFSRANAVVTQYGGRPAASGDAYYSTQWWALWSGLGDFDEKYGFLADDRAGLSYYYGLNASRPSEQMHRNNYLATIKGDPAWFARIVGARLKRVLVDNTPYRLSFGSKYYDIHLSATIVTGLGLLLLMAELLIHGKHTLQRPIVNLYVLSLSVGLVAVGQLADYGLQFYAIAHLFLFAYVACSGLEAVLALIWSPVAARRGSAVVSGHV
jgi:hypothetical protein